MTNQSQQRVAVITGASSGIGKEAAKSLAGQGWQVFAIGRNADRCDRARAEIVEQACGKHDQVTMICADLALMADTERVARAVTGNTDRVDILINNAGGVTKTLTITPEGNENTFASNHLGHFLLTRRLLPLLYTASASSPRGSVRIINMSSAAHHACDGLDWDDLQMLGIKPRPSGFGRKANGW
jgi:NAD(P)-dependent dehydrogenase (short-subunit alcohol dehydrogenase family)